MAAFPDGWQCGTGEEAAAADIAGWDEDRAGLEFGKFRDHHLANGSQRADWSAAWRKWCHHGVEFDQRRPAASSISQRPTGVASALIGLKRAMDYHKAQQQDDDSDADEE